MLKRMFLVILLAFSVVLVACDPDEADTTDPSTDTGTDETTTTEDSNVGEEPTVIRIAVWWLAGDDPTYIDPATGEAPDTMSPAVRQARLDAIDTIKEELNVEVKFVEYPVNPTQDILQTVLANDPIAEIVGMWGGSQSTIVNQNVLQDLTPYLDDFGEEAFWLLGTMDMFGQTLGFAHEPLAGFPGWPLVYNIDYLLDCQALSQSDEFSDSEGNVLLPAQLWDEDRWTWETFRSYLSHVKTCTDNMNVGGEGDGRRWLYPYQADHRQAYDYFAASNGEFTVRPDGELGVDSAASIEAIEFLQGLQRDDLIFIEVNNDQTGEPGWLWNGGNFSNGEAVFTEIHNWGLDEASHKFSERGEQLGIVPHPVGPRVKAGDAEYHVPNYGGNTFGIPKGIDEKTTRLAIKTWAMYWSESFKNLGHEDTQAYIEASNATTGAAYFPISDERYGESILNAYNDWLSLFSFDSSEMLGVRGALHGDIQEIIYKPEINAKTRMEQEKPVYESSLEKLRDGLESEDYVDNQAPVINLLEGKELIFPVGTDLEKVDWFTYFEAYDIGFDTAFSFSDVDIDYSEIVSDEAGNESSLILTGVDSSENETEAKFTVTFYNENDDVKPIIELVDDEKEIRFAIDHTVSSINWTDFVRAFDKIILADGTVATETNDDGELVELTFDLNGRMKHDVSYLDVSAPGEYDVTFTVEDYAGNEFEYKITVEIYDPALED